MCMNEFLQDMSGEWCETTLEGPKLKHPYPCLFRVPSVAMMCLLVYAGINLQHFLMIRAGHFRALTVFM